MTVAAEPQALRVAGIPITRGRVLWLSGVAALLAVLPQPWHQLHAPLGFRLVDLQVYREAGTSLLHDRSVYDYLTPAPQRLPFTYPPTSAVLALLLAVLPLTAMNVAWTALSYALVLGLTIVAFRRALLAAGPDRAAWLLPALFAGACYLLPVRSHIHFGQVGLLLMALCVADCLLPRTPWPRGVLVGLATAVKLTPGVFFAFLWLSGRRRAAVTAAASCLGFIAVTWALLPGTSSAYWTDALFSAGRLGDNTNTSNQAIRGMLLRFQLPHLVESLALLGLVALIGVVGFRRATRASKEGHELAGVAITGLLAVLLSPVAWIHHLVWVLLVLGVMVGSMRDRRRVIGAGVLAVVFLLAVPWWGDHAIYRHIPKQRMTYSLPGDPVDHAMPLQGVPSDIPAEARFFRHTKKHGVIEMPAAAVRPWLGSCLSAAMERNCLESKHPGSTVWPWRLLQSSYCLIAMGLVLWLPTGPDAARPSREAPAPSLP